MTHPENSSFELKYKKAAVPTGKMLIPLEVSPSAEKRLPKSIGLRKAHPMNVGISINGGSPIAGWLLFFKSFSTGWFRGTPISGNLHVYEYP